MSNKENSEDIIGIDLESLATNVVDLFDQANTASAIENLGSRGALLKQAIAGLRFKLNSEKQRTILTGDQVGENVTEVIPRERV